MGERVRIVLVCDECGARNYQTTKSKITDAGRQDRLALKKYCPKCNRHTSHRESR